MRSLRAAARSLLYPIPQRMRSRHRKLGPEQVARLRDSISRNYHQGWRAREQYSAESYEADLSQHMFGRLQKDRELVLPWLDSAKNLDGIKVLEIGVGTGSSTVALAEQGARVFGVDVDEGSLAVARDRLELYGLEADLHLLNAQAAASAFAADPPDIIIFFACLEHMTLDERLETLPAMWSLLPKDGLLVIVETPNRIWYHDAHTAMLPFFHWLPDEIALRYSSFSPREVFKDRYRAFDEKEKEEFARQGRGVSYHELDLTIGKSESLRVVSSMSSFRGWRHEPRRPIRDRRFVRLLHSIRPDLHEGFMEPWLNLVIART